MAKQEGEFVADVMLKNPYQPNIGTLQLQPSQKPFK